MLTRTALAALFLMGAPAACLAATHYVVADAAGSSDDNDGTRAASEGGRAGPWRSIGRALRSARPGDTILVGSGRYREEVSITASRIQLRALAGARPVIDGENARPYGIVVPDPSAPEDVLVLRQGWIDGCHAR